MDDRATFDKMFNEWYAQFVYFAYYFVNDVEVCRDIVSDAFEYLWRNYDKIEEVFPFVVHCKYVCLKPLSSAANT